MDHTAFTTLADAAGLAETARRFPDDVKEAMATLARHKAHLPRSSDPRLEPLPAYSAPKGDGR